MLLKHNQNVPNLSRKSIKSPRYQTSLSRTKTSMFPECAPRGTPYTLLSIVHLSRKEENCSAPKRPTKTSCSTCHQLYMASNTLRILAVEAMAPKRWTYRSALTRETNCHRESFCKRLETKKNLVKISNKKPLRIQNQILKLSEAPRPTTIRRHLALVLLSRAWRNQLFCKVSKICSEPNSNQGKSVTY